MRRKLLALSVLSILAMSVSAALFAQQSSHRESGIDATVHKVLDGDTIELANHDVVRLIGVDAPEKGQPYYEEATGALRKIEGRAVKLEKDTTNKDRYDRYLRYVYLDGSFVNLELVRSGLAYAYIVEPDDRHEDDFLEAENAARAAKVGVWDGSEHSECVSLASLHYNARGDDRENLSDEYFVLENSCGRSVDAHGWAVKNKARGYLLPGFSIGPGSRLKIVSGNATFGSGDLSLSSEVPVWNNAADSLYLIDGSGRVILSKSYKNSAKSAEK